MENNRKDVILWTEDGRIEREREIGIGRREIADGRKHEREATEQERSDGLMPGLLPNGANHGNVTLRSFPISPVRFDDFSVRLVRLCFIHSSRHSLVVIVIVNIMTMGVVAPLLLPFRQIFVFPSRWHSVHMVS
ncbi:uncharacterized protein AKAW2_10316A [Aspergillus luchuensis]|uniref:Uncharacterized protein n=1 Tax=Aspergillus kawachii TaxID=1069201 RepID=A0A7R7VYX4_ASPKA|nr:uncharacterized protein AKAW2_10316A [Aspergillus luchuensis]BCR93270.1 hypothetical protein AKAW2_10316A [Aspergillus luchuensis]